MIIRGPGVAENITTELVTTHTDLAPTILKLIGARPRPDFDGSAIPVHKEGVAAAEAEWHEHVNVEYWGFAVRRPYYSTSVIRSLILRRLEKENLEVSVYGPNSITNS